MFYQVKSKVQHYYVATLLDLVGRGLVAASQVDTQMQHDLAKLPVGLIISMQVLATDLAFYLRVTEQKTLQLLEKDQTEAVDVLIQFKHLQHAFLVLSFQESTAIAFANNRMTVDGHLAYAVRLVRCLNRLESVILPKVIALKAVKSYPERLHTKQKVTLAGQVYCRVVGSYFKRK